MQRNDDQTYGTVLPAGDATFALVTTDRPLGRLTVLALATNRTLIVRHRYRPGRLALP